MTDVPPFLFRFYRPFCVGVDLSCDMKSSREFDFAGCRFFAFCGREHFLRFSFLRN